MPQRKGVRIYKKSARRMKRSLCQLRNKEENIFISLVFFTPSLSLAWHFNISSDVPLALQSFGFWCLYDVWKIWSAIVIFSGNVNQSFGFYVVAKPFTYGLNVESKGANKGMVVLSVEWYWQFKTPSFNLKLMRFFLGKDLFLLIQLFYCLVIWVYCVTLTRSALARTFEKI